MGYLSFLQGFLILFHMVVEELDTLISHHLLMESPISQCLVIISHIFFLMFISCHQLIIRKFDPMYNFLHDHYTDLTKAPLLSINQFWYFICILMFLISLKLVEYQHFIYYRFSKMALLLIKFDMPMEDCVKLLVHFDWMNLMMMNLSQLFSPACTFDFHTLLLLRK